MFSISATNGNAGTASPASSSPSASGEKTPPQPPPTPPPPTPPRNMVLPRFEPKAHLNSWAWARATSIPTMFPPIWSITWSLAFKLLRGFVVHSNSNSNSNSNNANETETVPPDSAWRILPAQMPHPRSRRIAVVGVHGWFPGWLIRSAVTGKPTGTSQRFAEKMEQAVRQFFLQHHNINLSPNAITSIALEGHGKVENRVEKLYAQIMSPSTSYASTLAEADTIFIASHSQGSPVSVILIARLIREGLISPSRQRICILLMAGISHGPFPHLKSSFVVKHVEAESARQLFDFNDPGTAITRRYHAAISQVLNAGVRICAVASWYDQVVPLYSATLHAFNHPAIYRAIHIEGSDYTPDFLSHLVVFALRLRNAGLSDRGLLVYLSEFLAGNVYGFGTQGHSTVYEEVETYVLAVKWGLSEPVPYSYINIKKRLFENRNDDSSISNSGGEKINKPKCCNPYDPYDPYIASTSSKKLLVPLKAGVTDPRPPFEPHPENPISDLLITVDPTYHTKFSAPLSKLNGTWLPWIMAQLTSDPLVYANQDLRVHLDEVIRLFDEWEPNGKVLKELQYRLEPLRSKL